MRNSFTSVPRAPMRGDLAPKKPAGFAAIAEERVAKQAKAPVQPKPAYPNPEWMPGGQKQAPAQAPKALKIQQPETKSPGGMTGDYSLKPKTAGGQADVRAAALSKFGQGISPTAPKKESTTPQMAGGYVKPKAPLGDPTASIDYGAVQQYQDSLNPEKNPGPGFTWDAKFKNPDGSQGKWVAESKDKLPPGVSFDDPGWTWSGGEWVYDPNAAGGAAIDAELAAALKGSPEDYGMSPEMKAKAKQSLLNQAAQAKADLSQSMAGRGLGASGLTGAGFGQIDVGTQSALADMELQNWQAGVDNRINELKTLLTARGNEMSEKNRREIADQIAELEKAKFEDSKSQQDEADNWTALSNMLGLQGGDQWDSDTLSWVYEQLADGVPADVIFSQLTVSSGSNGKTVLKTGDGPAYSGISGPAGQDGEPGANYADPTEVPWGAMSPEEQADAYDDYASAALGAGQTPLSEEDWTLWQYARDDYKG